MTYLVIAIFWVMSSLMIGILGRKKALGFWGFFIVSLILSFVTGFMLLIFFEVLSLVSESRQISSAKKA